MNVLSFVRKRAKLRGIHLYTDRMIVRRMVRSGVTLLLLLFTHTVAMTGFEGLEPGEALWLTLTTITTVGYGDFSASSSMGRVATVLLLYLFGITLLATLASDYIDFRISRKERMRTGQWRWNMRKHIVFINSPKNNGEQYFIRIVSQLREQPDYRHTDILLLTPAFPGGLPHALSDLGVVHVTGSPDTFEDLNQASVADARHIVVLAEDEYDHRSDSHTFAVVHRLMELGVAARTLAECVLDENRERIRGLGVQTSLRPIRSYPEIIVRAITAPGTEVVLEDLFTYGGDHPRRYDLQVRGVRWADIVSSLSQADLGTPIAYVSRSNAVVVHPHGRETVDAVALIIIVRSESIPELPQVSHALGHHSGA